MTRIAGTTPAANAIAVARFSKGAFGWGVLEPGHGLVFANSSRPLDAPAAAPLSARGDYGPLLLLEGPEALSSELGGYLSDLQPGSPPSGPVHGVYNHGWLIGDETAISATTQARLDTLLEISSRTAPEASFSSPTTPSKRIDTQRIDTEQRTMSQAENPQRLIRERSGEVSVEDVRELMGASTPHFALQLRNRIARLVAGLPPITRRGWKASARSRAWSALALPARHAARPATRASCRCLR